MTYRPEIDGLRAIAVISVILFHMGFSTFSGGFVGVDVFFVISGYLITNIILKEVYEGRFSLVYFYERRARRILPALLFVILSCLPFAWVLLEASEFDGFLRSILSVLVFSSNVFFWSQSGYFDADSESKPLLHTWSLGLEEQYYIVFPILFLLAFRYFRKGIYPLFFAILVLSLVGSNYLAHHSASANFYLLPSRFWELMLGGFSAFLLKDGKLNVRLYFADVMTLLGLSFIIYSIIFFNEETPFPSFYALIPTVGALLIILFGDVSALSKKILRFRLLTGLGLISYSAYLVHQPLLVFVGYIFDETFLLKTILFPLIFVLAYLVWRYVEIPWRYGSFKSRKSLVYSFSGVSLFLLAFSFAGIADDGYMIRYDPNERKIIEYGSDKSFRKPILGESTKTPKIALIGDSHANGLQEALDNVLQSMHTSAKVMTIDGCPPVRGLYRHDLDYGDRCDKHYQKVYSSILSDDNIEIVIISARYTLYLESTRFDNGEGGVERGASKNVVYDSLQYKDTMRPIEERRVAVADAIVNDIRELALSGKKIIAIAPIPEVGWDVPKALVKKYNETGQLTVNTKKSIYDERNSVAVSLLSELSQMDNVYVLRPDRVFCTNFSCAATHDGLPLYFDTNHLNNFGAAFLLRGIELKGLIGEVLGGKKSENLVRFSYGNND